MKQRTRYSFGREVRRPFGEVLAAAGEALQRQGFGILSEIDVQAKLQEKLGIEFPPYRILGACNPRLASQALGAEPDLGTLLPCNVVVYEKTPGMTVVAAMDPVAVLGLVGNPDVEPIAEQVRDLVGRALDEI